MRSGYEEHQFYPIYFSKESFKDHMELLILTQSNKSHFVLMSDFNELLFEHFCTSCLHYFSSERVLNHKKVCLYINGQQGIRMPEEGFKVKVENFYKQLKVSFIIYADFEAITQKIDGCQPNDANAYQKHKDCFCSYKVVCCYNDRYSKAVYKFMENMLDELEWKNPKTTGGTMCP